MKTTNVRDIKQAINAQAMKGNRSVTADMGRIIDAKMVKGKLR